jgi:cytochrome-b5 reductase
VRRYATEPAKSSNTLLYAAVGAVTAGAGYYFLSGSGAQKVDSKALSLPAKKAFTGADQGFVPLTVTEVETLNHNTKRVRFKLPEDDMVSGLHVASAVLTKFQAPGMDKPVLRPYTPINDEGLYLHLRRSTASTRMYDRFANQFHHFTQMRKDTSISS